MKQLNVKKLVLLNLPYILLGLFATNLGEAWRLAAGADVSAKMLSFFSTLPVALGSWWPSLHPLDLAVGICCGAALRLAVYLKSKNAKKYRHNMEYGSARWWASGCPAQWPPAGWTGAFLCPGAVLSGLEGGYFPGPELPKSNRSGVR